MIADIIAQDAEGSDVLVVEVKGRLLSPEVVAQVWTRMAEVCPLIPFGMIVDPEGIRIAARQPSGFALPAQVLTTSDVLRHYDPELGNQRVFGGYLETLVEGWLRDLATHWKTETPPGANELARIGLSQLLEGGTTRREVPLGADSLR
jgi:hypothetical protein